MYEPRKVTAGDHAQCAQQAPAQSPLTTVKIFASRQEWLSEGSLRHLLFHRRKDLELEGIVVRFGSRILIDEQRFLDWLRAGQARSIVGGAR